MGTPGRRAGGLVEVLGHSRPNFLQPKKYLEPIMSGRMRPRDTFYRALYYGDTEAQAQVAVAVLHGPIAAAEFGYIPGVSEKQAALDTIGVGTMFDLL